MDDILYLDSDEEITLVVDKMRQSMATKLSFVVPKEATLLQSIVNLKLIKKEAESLKKEICLITSDKVAHNLASQVGILVYENIKQTRPVNAHSRPQPSVDDVIELNMEEEKSQKTKSDLKVRHFQDPEKKEKVGNFLTKAISSDGSIPSQLIEKERNLETVHFEDEIETELEPVLEPKKAVSHFPSNTPRHDKIYIPKWLIISVFAIIILGGLSYLLFPRAQVELLVKSEDFEKSLEMIVDKGAKEADAAKNTIPGKEIEVTKELSKEYNATGWKNNGEKAKGTITFYNSWDTNAQDILAGTRLVYTDGKIFTLEKKITIPGATVLLSQGKLTKNPGSTTGTVISTEPGEEYNVSAGKFYISDFSGLKRDQIYGESTRNLTGGTTVRVSVIQQSDIDSAKENLINDLLPEANIELSKNIGDSKLVEGSTKVEILESTPDKKAGDEAEKFKINAKAKVKAIVFEEVIFDETFARALERFTPDGKELVLEGSETAISKPEFNPESGVMKVQSSVKAKIRPKIDEQEIKDLISGQGINEAQTLLTNINGIQEASVSLSPNWQLAKIPYFKSRIKIVVNYQ